MKQHRDFNASLLESANKGKNQVLHSRIKEFDYSLEDCGLSIKWAHKGLETYQIEQEEIAIKDDQFMVIFPGKKIQFQIASQEFVEGTCIYLDPQMCNEIWSHQNSTLDKQLEFSYSNTQMPQIIDSIIYNLNENCLGQWLGRLKNINWSVADETFFWQVAEKIIECQKKELDKATAIPAAKMNTKIELYRRLSLAHMYIRDSFKDDINLDELAQTAMLSKFHLIRTFRQLYGASPMKLLYRYRLDHAKKLIREAGKEADIKAIALETGFPTKRSLMRFLNQDN